MRQNIILEIKICHSKFIVLKVPFRNPRLKRSYVKANLNQVGFMLKTLNVLLTKCYTYPTEICKMPDCDCKLHNAKVWRLGNQQHLPELPSPQDASQSAKKTNSHTASWSHFAAENHIKPLPPVCVLLHLLPFQWKQKKLSNICRLQLCYEMHAIVM